MPVNLPFIQPLSFEQNTPGLQGYAQGQQIGANNLAQALQAAQLPYAQPMAQASLQQQQLANALAQQKLPFVAPQAQADINLAKAQAGLFGGQTGQAQAHANQLNTGTVSQLLTDLQNAQGTKAYVQKLGGDTSGLDSIINNRLALLSQAGVNAGFNVGGAPQNQPQVNRPVTTPVVAAGTGLTPLQLQTLRSMNLGGGQQLPIGNPGVSQGSPAQATPQPGFNQGFQQNAQTPAAQPSAVAAQPVAQPLYPLQQQQKDIQDSKELMGFAALSGNQKLIDASNSLFSHAMQGTPIQRDLASTAAKLSDLYDHQFVAASQLKPLIAQYNRVLQTIPPAAFALGINKVSPEFVPKIQSLQSLSKQMIGLDAALTGLNTNRITNMEFNTVGKATAHPQQFLSTIQSQLQNLDNIADRAISTKQRYDNYLTQGKGAQGFGAPQNTNQSVAQSLTPQNSSPAKMTLIEATDKNGKVTRYNIPSQNLAAALKRGARQVQ